MSKDLDISSALVVLSKNYNVSTDEIKRVLDNIFDNVSNKQKLENTETKAAELEKMLVSVREEF